MTLTPWIIRATQAAILFAALPAIILSFAGGPDPRFTGAPGDSTCARSGCHTGVVNSGPGGLRVAFPAGLEYTPGVRQRWELTVSDPFQRVFGFQATTRLASNPTNGQAGTFHAVDATTRVICDNGSARGTDGCPASAAVEFIQHTGPSSTGRFTIEWTPPAANVGAVHVYIAGNAANDSSTSAGDRIYTANYTLTPAAPTTSLSRIVDSFNYGSGIAPNTWTSIFGGNLAPAQTSWNDAIRDEQLPTELSGVTVTVDGHRAVLSYVSPSLINLLVPLEIGSGDVDVVVRNNLGESPPFVVRAATSKPAFYAPFVQNDRFYITAVALDGTFVGKTGGDPRVTRGARPGELLQLYGTGFGTTDPVIPIDRLTQLKPAMVSPVQIKFGDANVPMVGRGVLIGPGLYQFNIMVPDVPPGELPLTVEIAGIPSASNVYIVIER